MNQVVYPGYSLSFSWTDGKLSNNVIVSHVEAFFFNVLGIVEVNTFNPRQQAVTNAERDDPASSISWEQLPDSSYQYLIINSIPADSKHCGIILWLPAFSHVLFQMT